MSSLRSCLLAFAAPWVLAVPAAAQVAVPAPAITPGVLVMPGTASAPAEVAEVAEAEAEPAVLAIPATWAPVPRDDENRSAYGLYLAGRLASGRGEGETGAAYLAAARRLVPEQPSLNEQAFLAALVSGDLEDAAAARPTEPGAQPVLVEIGRLVDIVLTYRRGDARAALADLTGQPIQPPHGLAGTLLTPWIAAEAGDWDRALLAPPTGTGNPISTLQRFNRAQLLEIRRSNEEAEAEYRDLVATLPQELAFRSGYGAFLERQGRKDEAVALYAAAPASQDPTLRLRLDALRQRAESDRAPARLTLRNGAAGALDASADIISQIGGEQFAPVYRRLALAIEPNDARRMALANDLAEARLEPAARAAYASVPADDPFAFAAARSALGRTWIEDEDYEKALTEYRAAHEALPENALTAYFLASTLVQLDRHDEALALLNGPVLNTPNQGAEIHFMRGAAYESIGRIEQAEAELWAALQQRPDEPAFLNYLGYLWVDSGRRVAEGAEMIERAHAADPEDGNIQDSLGWAQYRQGRYEEAVVNLEQAVAKEPANAEINDHLGDAYWQVGRTREAEFQWTRVLTLDPEDERRAEVERKLADGLTPPSPVAMASNDGGT